MSASSSKSNPKTINEHFDRKYGKVGTKSRTNFEENAELYIIAELIRDKRKEAKMTQQELADKLNVKRTYISKLERAVGDVRISTLRRIVEVGLGGKLDIRVKL
ncbi:MAG: helix-turn-helix domain-containing protein [Flavobacteriales bacterium]|nr:helix-turn-helix domain-containing protein [Flavobacteriales bacterium]